VLCCVLFGSVSCCLGLTPQPLQPRRSKRSRSSAASASSSPRSSLRSPPDPPLHTSLHSSTASFHTSLYRASARAGVLPEGANPREAIQGGAPCPPVSTIPEGSSASMRASPGAPPRVRVCLPPSPTPACQSTTRPPTGRGSSRASRRS